MATTNETVEDNRKRIEVLEQQMVGIARSFNEISELSSRIVAIHSVKMAELEKTSEVGIAAGPRLDTLEHQVKELARGLNILSGLIKRKLGKS